MVDAMVEEWLWDIPPDKGVLFDGFPRTRYQAKFLDELLMRLKRELEIVLYLKVPDEVVIQRLAGRVLCRQCQTPYHLEFNPPAKAGSCDRCGGELYKRPDDIPEIMRVRLRAFRRVTGPLLDYYQDTNRLIIIDGDGSIDQVSQAIIEAVEAVGRQEARVATRQETIEIQTVKDREIAIVPERTLPDGLNLVLLGGPGSGKGTQAEYLEQELKLQHISTGELFRENIQAGTELGRLAQQYINRGELAPDEVTEAIVEARLAQPDTQRGFILDGFPRTLAQAEALTEIMAGFQRHLSGVIYLKVSETEIIKRVSGRLICRECQATFHQIYNPFETCPYGKCKGEYLYRRDDDKPETVYNRLKTFHRETLPLINYYQEARLLIEVDGEGELAEVKERMLIVVQSLVKAKTR
jgi:adenylate kinase